MARESPVIWREGLLIFREDSDPLYARQMGVGDKLQDQVPLCLWHLGMQ